MNEDEIPENATEPQEQSEYVLRKAFPEFLSIEKLRLIIVDNATELENEIQIGQPNCGRIFVPTSNKTILKNCLLNKYTRCDGILSLPAKVIKLKPMLVLGYGAHSLSWYLPLSVGALNFRIDNDNLIQSYSNDVIANAVINKYTGTHVNRAEERIGNYLHVDFWVREGIILYRGRIYIPANFKIPASDPLTTPTTAEISARKSVIIRSHELCLHSSASRTIEVVTSVFNWPGLTEDVENQLLDCSACNYWHKHETSTATFKYQWLPRGLFAVLFIAHITDLVLDTSPPGPPANCILRVTDSVCRMVWLFPTKGTGLEQVKDHLVTVWSQVGMPIMVRGDRAFRPLAKWLEHKKVLFKQFSDSIKTEELSMTVSGGLPANPRAHWYVERPNREEKERLFKECSNSKRWKRILPMLQLLGRSKRLAGLGKCPLEIAHGQSPILPGCSESVALLTLGDKAISHDDAAKYLEEFRETLQQKAEDRNFKQNLSRLNKHGIITEYKVSVGDYVACRSDFRSKSQLEYGPPRSAVYQVVEIAGDQLRMLGISRTILTIEGERIQVGNAQTVKR